MPVLRTKLAELIEEKESREKRKLPVSTMAWEMSQKFDTLIHEQRIRRWLANGGDLTLFPAEFTAQLIAYLEVSPGDFFIVECNDMANKESSNG